MNPRKHKTLEETMKTVIVTPNPSVKSSVTVDRNPPEIRDSFYFPGCKKDANCNCEICIASINATLDLMPQSTQRSSFAKFPSSKISVSRSPIPFNPSSADLSTPISRAVTPPRSFNKRIGFQEKVESRKEGSGYGAFVKRTFWGVILVFGVDYGISLIVSGAMQEKLSTDLVKNLGVKSRGLQNLNSRFLFLKDELEGVIGKEVLSCSSNDDSLWKINQDGMLLSSRCVLYKSMIEEVSIWGWPLQTSGLLAADYSSRSFTIISGRVTEWSNGDAKYLVRKADNSSWEQGKWNASIVQFDPNTWILEYRRSFLVDSSNLVSAAMELLRFRLMWEFQMMKRDFWLGPAFRNLRFENTRRHTPPPT